MHDSHDIGHVELYRCPSKSSQLYLGYVLLRYVLIYNLKVSFNFHLTFLQLNVIKMFTVQ